MKKIIIFCLLFLLIGCVNNDINNIAIINEIVIDYDTSYKVYIKVLENDDDENKIYFESGNTLEECFSNLSSSLSKKAYLTHLETLTLTDSIKKEQLNEIINYFLSQESSRNSFNTIFINSYNESFFDFKSIELENMLNTSINSNGLVKEKKFDEIVKDLLNYKISYIPYFNLYDKKFIGYKSVYDENKLLSKDKSIALNFIMNKIENVTLLINNSNFKLENCNTSIKKNKNNIIFNIKCEYDGENVDVIEKYIDDSINKLIKENKNNYFEYISDKYGIKNNADTNIKIEIIKINRNSGDNFA